MPPPDQSPAARRLAFLAFLAFLLTSLSRVVSAEPSAPWTPTVASRHALELLVDESGLALPITQRPLPRSAVKRALDALPRELPPALDAARERVAAELRAAEVLPLSLAVRGRAEALSGFGDEGRRAAGSAGAAARCRRTASRRRSASASTRGTVPSHADAKLRLHETAIAIEAFGTQLQAWAHRSWWGPGWQSSLVLGNNAPPLYGIGLQRASAGQSDSRWLSWMGPWSYEFFVAADDNTIDSYLVGMRITMRPFSLLEIGLSRAAQWGGQGRDESVNSFLRMLRSSGVTPTAPRCRPRTRPTKWRASTCGWVAAASSAALSTPS